MVENVEQLISHWILQREKCFLFKIDIPYTDYEIKDFSPRIA